MVYYKILAWEMRSENMKDFRDSEKVVRSIIEKKGCFKIPFLKSSLTTTTKSVKVISQNAKISPWSNNGLK